ncbi:hypothetical protein [Paenibacillus donghaensis]
MAEVFPQEERGKAMGMAMSGQTGGVLARASDWRVAL